MSDTPRTDAAWKTTPSVYDFIVEMKRIERELNAANAQIDRLTAKVAQLYEGAEEQKQRIKRLEEGGDKAILNSYLPDRLAVWNKAKEDKP